MLRVIAMAGLLVAVTPPLTSQAFAQSGLPDAVAIGPYLNQVFPESLNEVDAADVSYSQRNYFPDVSFTEPVRIVEHPNQREILIVSKDGLGHLISNTEGASDKRLFFDIREIMHGNPKGEGGISDLVFHPKFEQQGQTGHNEVFISYWWSPDNSGTVSNDNGFDGYNRVSRFSVVDGVVDLGTEQVLISQYDREMWHIGMDMDFGNDGFLYIAAADETPTDCCSFADSTQSLSGGLWSGVLRIDVDNDPARSHPIRRQPIHPTADPRDNGSHWPRSFSQGYSIPDDNPFVAADGSQLEEFYSLGLRHPWTMSIDKQTGQVWVADVGRRDREEINLVNKGDNNQWPYRQGTLAGPIDKPDNIIGNEAPPTFEYEHIPGGNAVIGAGVYRGSLYPELTGKYLFSDFVRGDFWTLTPDGQSGYSVQKIGDLSRSYGNGINSYLLDSGGRILLSRTNGDLRDGGTVELLVREVNGAVQTELPPTLSATGAFTDFNTMAAAPGCIDYELNVPFWSDGAEKYRWMCLPNDGSHNTAAETIVFSENDPWSFPAGTVFIKHFEMNKTDDDDTTAFPIETRFLIITTDGHYGVSYRWNAAGTQASLVGSDGARRSFTQQTTTGSVTRNWDFPSRSQCLQCHSEESGAALAVNTRQLNKPHRYHTTSTDANQLVTFDALNLFSRNINASELIGRVVTASATDDSSASIEDRARSYLDANCAYCHHPTGVRANFDARLTTPLDSAGLINGSLIEHGDGAGAAVISPGSLQQSIAYTRTAAIGNDQMPPLGKNIADVAGIDILERWILSLGTNDDEPDEEPDNGSTDNDDTDPATGDDDSESSNSAGVSTGGTVSLALLIPLFALLLILHRQQFIGPFQHHVKRNRDTRLFR